MTLLIVSITGRRALLNDSLQILRDIVPSESAVHSKRSNSSAWRRLLRKKLRRRWKKTGSMTEGQGPDKEEIKQMEAS